jgi:hypothetical protein
MLMERRGREKIREREIGRNGKEVGGKLGGKFCCL